MISETLATVAQVSVVAFVVTSMLALGMSLSMKAIIDPLRNPRLLLTILTASFVIVPLGAWLIARTLPLDAPAETAMILLGTMAGAPFLPKLAQMSKADVPLSVGTMVLLMVVTIVYAPIVVPQLIDGVDIAPWDIAKSLLILMLLPLGAALLFSTRYPETAASWAPDLSKFSTLSLIIGLAAGVLVAWEDILGSVGSWIFIATVLFATLSLVVGWLISAGTGVAVRKTIGLGTAQRNLAAALLVAGTNFDADTLVLTMVAALSLTILLLIVAGELGKRATAVEDGASVDAGTVPTAMAETR